MPVLVSGTKKTLQAGTSMPNQAWPLKELNKKKEPIGCAIPMAFLLGSHQLVADLRRDYKAFSFIGPFSTFFLVL